MDNNHSTPIYDGTNTQGYMTSQIQPNQAGKGGGGFAIASLVIGILSMTLCCWGGSLLGLTGLVLGIVGTVKKQKTGIAVAGIATSAVGILLGIIIIISTWNSLTSGEEIPEQSRYENEIEFIAEGAEDNEDVMAHTDAGADVTDRTDQESQQKDNGVEVSNLTGDWSNLEFILDGTPLSLPAQFTVLQEMGWDFELSDYGYSSYLLEPGEWTAGTIYLSNPAYDENLSFTVGFINDGDIAKEIKDCKIREVGIDTTHGFRQLKSYPQMEIAKGIHFGSTEEEVLAAFGAAEDIYIYDDAENGYKVYTYCYDYAKYLRITVSDALGVTGIEMKYYDS